MHWRVLHGPDVLLIRAVNVLLTAKSFTKRKRNRAQQNKRKEGRSSEKINSKVHYTRNRDLGTWGASDVLRCDRERRWGRYDALRNGNGVGYISRWIREAPTGPRSMSSTFSSSPGPSISGCSGVKPSPSHRTIVIRYGELAISKLVPS